MCIVAPLAHILFKLFKKVKCGGPMVGICAPHYSGKSYFINSVNSKKYALLDLEANIDLHMTADERNLLKNLNSENSSRNLHYFPIAKRYLDEIKKNHKGKKILVFSSNYELLEYCGIKYILSYVPSNSLSDNIKLNLDEQAKMIFDSNRVDLMLKAGKKLISYNNFDDFNKDIINKFKLQIKL